MTPIPPNYKVRLAQAHLAEALSHASRAFSVYDSPPAVKFMVPWASLEQQLYALLMGVFQEYAMKLTGEWDVLAGNAMLGSPQYWQSFESELGKQVLPVMQQAAQLGVANALQKELKDGPNIQVSWNLANQGAKEWAQAHAAQLVKQVSDQTRETLRNKVAGFIEQGGSTYGLGDEIAKITDENGSHPFNARRAQMIAQTESTNAFANGNILAWTERGYAPPALQPALHPGCRCRLQNARLADGSKVLVWHTVVDGKVCKAPHATPWGTVAGCSGLDRIIVSNGPYMGMTVQEAGGLYKPGKNPGAPVEPEPAPQPPEPEAPPMPPAEAFADIEPALPPPAPVAIDPKEGLDLLDTVEFSADYAGLTLEQKTKIAAGLGYSPQVAGWLEAFRKNQDPGLDEDQLEKVNTFSNTLYNLLSPKDEAHKENGAAFLSKVTDFGDYWMLPHAQKKEIALAMGVGPELVDWGAQGQDLTDAQKEAVGAYHVAVMEKAQANKQAAKLAAAAKKPAAKKPAVKPPLVEKKTKQQVIADAYGVVNKIYKNGHTSLGFAADKVLGYKDKAKKQIIVDYLGISLAEFDKVMKGDPYVNGSPLFEWKYKLQTLAKYGPDGSDVGTWLSDDKPAKKPKKPKAPKEPKAPDLGYSVPAPASAPPTGTEKPAAPQPGQPLKVSQLATLPTDKLKTIDLHAAVPSWKKQSIHENSRYGGAIFNDAGQVLLREPKGHYDGYAWTFPKGGPDPGDHPVDTALREVEEETGHKGEIIGLVQGGFSSGNSTNYFFVMRSAGSSGMTDAETAALRWVDFEEAKTLINQSTNEKGKQRDLQILQAAFAEHKKLIEEGEDYKSLLSLAKEPRKEPKPKEKPKPAAKPIPPAKIWPADPPEGFPAAPETLAVVGGLGGTTGAKLVQDSSGKKFVMKTGANASHLMEEAHSDSAYRAAGLNVPRFHVYQTAAGPVKVAEYIEGETLQKVMAGGNKTKINKVKKELQKGLAADALFGNVDVIGEAFDNILVDKSGKVWRIDNGGGLRYRAQGSTDKPAWGEYPTELWTMRNKEFAPGKRNRQTQEVFGGMKYADVVDQMDDLVKNRDAILAELPEEVQTTVAARLDHMEHLVKAGKALGKDQFADEYADDFGYDITRYGASGIVTQMPAAMKASKKSKTAFGEPIYDPHDVTNEEGIKFDGLRGSHSKPSPVLSKIVDYINFNGGDYRMVSDYLGSQAGSSWSSRAQAVKYAYTVKIRGLDPSGFYWRDGVQHAKRCYQEMLKEHGAAEEKLLATLRMYHAAQYEFLSKVDLPNKNPDGTLRLFRTDNEFVLANQGIHVGDTGVKINRGAIESFSGLAPVSVGDHGLTVQNVPVHHVIANYTFARDPFSGGTCLYGDGENEFLTLTDGLISDYIGRW